MSPLTAIYVTAPTRSYQTEFGRFYAHPKLQLDELQRRSAVFAPNEATPYSPNPSITNIIGMLDKAFLPRFFAKLVAEYAVDNLDSIRYQYDKFGRDVAVGALKSVPNRPSPAAAIGDEVHAAIDAHVALRPVEELSTQTARAMYAQFLHFAQETEIEFLRSEFTVWSYEHGYAGTGDLLAKTPEGIWVIDTKTGNQVYPEVAMQTAAIANADVILNEDGTESPMLASDFLGVLHVRPRSVKLWRLDRESEAFESFLACKRLFDWRRYDAPKVFGKFPDVKTERGSR